jgi:hypothetical protein
MEFLMLVRNAAYLSNPSDVLHAVLRGETQIFVQTESHIVSIESIGLHAEMEQVLLERRCDCRFARS